MISMSNPTRLILGIETSCDETAAAVVADGHDVRSNVVASQNDLHAEYGGVVPEIASRAHIERILPVVRAALDQAGVALDDIDAIAVGHRPGLIGSLLVGVAAAKSLAWSTGKPLIGIDHVMAHLYACRLSPPPKRGPEGVKPEVAPPAAPPPTAFPALGLVVSGGHTNMFLLHDFEQIEMIGRTIDDAVGEAYDKAASILELGFPGGPIVDRRARNGDERAHALPISRLEPDSLDFSFSGLKTALLYAARGKPQGRGREVTYERSVRDLTDAQIDDLCASFQRVAIAAVRLKMERALEQLRDGRLSGGEPRTLLIGGGVSANSRMRSEAIAFAAENGLALTLPAMAYCTDNAAMIAGLADRRLLSGHFDPLSLSPSPAGVY